MASPLSSVDLAREASSLDSIVAKQTFCARAWLARYKIMASVCAVLISVGSHFFGTSYGSLKTSLLKNMHITQTQYGLSQAADNLFNIFMPLIAGVLFDYYGTGFGSVFITAFILLGNILVGLSITTNNYALLVMGRLVYGVGAGSVNVIQQVIIAHWFMGKQLGKALAIIITMNRITQALGSAIIVPAAAVKGRHYGFGVWIACGVAAISVLANIMYIFLLRVTKQRMITTEQRTEMKKKQTFSIHSILGMSHTFWLIILINWLSAGVMTSFLGLAADFLKRRDGTSETNAAYKTTITLAVTVILNPILGIVIDRIGQRVTWGAIAMTLLCIFIGLLGFTSLNSYVLMVILAISIGFKGLSQLSSIPILVPYQHTATAFAIFKCSSSISTTILDLLSAIIQDNTEGESYSSVMLLFLILSLLALIANIFWLIMDSRRYNGLMQLNDQNRKFYMEKKRLSEGNDRALNALNNKRLGVWNKVYGVLFFGSMLAGFVIFIYTAATLKYL